MRTCLLLILHAVRSQADTTINSDAHARWAERKEWRRAWPAGCRKYADRKEAKGRFCSLASSTHSRDPERDILDQVDVVMILSGVNRLRELAGAFEKRQARERTKASEVGTPHSIGRPTGQDYAAMAALRAVEVAEGKHIKRDDERRQQARKQKKKVPAKRLSTEYRCTKVTSGAKTVEAVQFTCSVSDYALEAAAAAGDAKAKAAAARETDGERCAKYASWKAGYDEAVGEGGLDVSFFERFLSAQHEPFAALEKLHRHLHAVGGETGKARDAIERKATTTYRALSKDIHPDKLPKDCATEMKEMMRAVFERAGNLKHCILKPLRCKLPEPRPLERTYSKSEL
mmetsp:Transcript_31507/g.67756  ORF Transcript_31507/g.67756 Transcript_31507/m.67756 type:complete len:344 (-) Transcript_31507:156-1187(-)